MSLESIDMICTTFIWEQWS